MELDGHSYFSGQRMQCVIESDARRAQPSSGYTAQLGHMILFVSMRIYFLCFHAGDLARPQHKSD